MWFSQRSTAARLEYLAFVGAASGPSTLHAHQQQQSTPAGKTRRDASTDFHRIAKCFGRHESGIVHPTGGTATLTAPRMCASPVRESSSLRLVDFLAGFSVNVGACVYALHCHNQCLFRVSTGRESNASTEKKSFNPMSRIYPSSHCSIATPHSAMMCSSLLVPSVQLILHAVSHVTVHTAKVPCSSSPR